MRKRHATSRDSSGPATAVATSTADADPDALHREFTTVVVAFHERVARRLGMSAAEHKVLGVLRRLRVATPGQLAAETGLTTGAITGIVDRLEAGGYARREPNPEDRRSVLIRPHQEGRLRRLLTPIFDSVSAGRAKVAAGYTPAEQAAIHRYLSEIAEMLRGEMAALNATGSGRVNPSRPGAPRVSRRRRDG